MPPQAEIDVRVAGLRKRYGASEVVCGVDFSVGPSECFGLLGPNGAGKTTTIRMITCFSPPSAGDLTVFGLPVTQHRAIKARLGLAPQEENLDPDLSVEMNLIIYASYFGIPRAEARTRMVPIGLGRPELTFYVSSRETGEMMLLWSQVFEDERQVGELAETKKKEFEAKGWREDGPAALRTKSQVELC